MATATVRRSAAGVALILLLSSCLAAPGPAATPHLSLTACTVQRVSAKCGQLAVAENPKAPGGRQISLNVVVIPARLSNHAPDPLFYLAGGPGGAATNSTQWAYTHFSLLNQRHDIVLIDQRGTGGSNPVSCSTVGSSSTEAAIAAVMKDCLTSMKAKGDPRFYTTPFAVDDFDQVRAALGYEQIDLYGGSYGVSSGLDYIQRHGDHVRAAILESGSLLDFHLWERVPVSAQHSLDEVFARCAAQQGCAAAFPNFKADFASVTAHLSRAPVTTQIVNPISGGFLSIDLSTFLNLVIDDYLGDVRSAAALPRDIHLAASGDWTPFMDLFTRLVGTGSSTPVMFITIICSDEWAVLNPATVATVAPGSAFTLPTLAKAAQYNAACKSWPRAVGASGPVNSSAPIVFLNGTADPTDPPANVAQAAATMPNSLEVPIPGYGHGVIDQDPSSCLAEKAQAFIESGQRSTQSSWQSCPNPLPSFLIQ